jgi:Xaa-Pro aminopeptidase
MIKLMKTLDLDGLLLSSPENVFYTTGFPTLPGSGNPIIYALRNQNPFFSYVDREGQVTLLAWGGAAMGIEYGTEDVRMSFTPQMLQDDLGALFAEKLSSGATVGVESTLPYYALRLLQDRVPDAQLALADDLLQELRLIKSPAEVDRLRRSTQIIDRTVQELADGLRLGMGRLELVREAKYRMIKNGADGVDHVTVAFGSANPEVALDEPLERDQIVTLDLGAVYLGYVSDNRRLVFTGAIPGPLRNLHQKLCSIVAGMGASLQPGKTFAELHAHAFELYAQAGIEPMFLHVGHSLGLQVEEHWIMADDPTSVQPGMVLNIELYSPSEAGIMVGDEETFLVTGAAPEQLSTLPVEMIERKL